MDDGALRDRIHLPSVLFALAFVGVMAAIVVLGDGPLPLGVVVFGVVGAVYLFAASLDVVRDHELYELARALVLAVLLGLWWLIVESGGLIPAFLVAIAVLAVFVELYNYATGASLLRIES